MFKVIKYYFYSLTERMFSLCTALHLTVHCTKAIDWMQRCAPTIINKWKFFGRRKKKSTNCASMVRIATRKTGASTSNLIGNVMILNDPMSHSKNGKKNCLLRKYVHIACSCKIIHENNENWNNFTNFNCKLDEKRIHRCLLSAPILIGYRAAFFLYAVR